MREGAPLRKKFRITSKVDWIQNLVCNHVHLVPENTDWLISSLISINGTDGSLEPLFEPSWSQMLPWRSKVSLEQQKTSIPQINIPLHQYCSACYLVIFIQNLVAGHPLEVPDFFVLKLDKRVAGQFFNGGILKGKIIKQINYVHISFLRYSCNFRAFLVHCNIRITLSLRTEGYYILRRRRGKFHLMNYDSESINMSQDCYCWKLQLE